MASKKNEKTWLYEVYFHYGGRLHHRGLGTDDDAQANAIKATVEETLHDLKRGRLTLPADCDHETL